MMGDWTFFSNYGHVLVCLSRNNQARLKDVAFEVGITERAVQKIVRDMQDAGFITVSKQGRCNRYRLNKRKSLRHGLESHCNIGKLLALVTRPDPIRIAAEKSKDVESAVAVTARLRKQKHSEQSMRRQMPVSEPVGQTAAKTSGPKEKADKTLKPVDSRHQGSLF